MTEETGDAPTHLLSRKLLSITHVEFESQTLGREITVSDKAGSKALDRWDMQTDTMSHVESCWKLGF